MAIALAMLPLGGAADCEPITSRWMLCDPHLGCVSNEVVEHHYAVVDRPPWNTIDLCTTQVWVYEETNGIDGLQRSDDSVGDQTCGLHPADRVVF